jgi:hypothetical protein
MKRIKFIIFVCFSYPCFDVYIDDILMNADQIKPVSVHFYVLNHWDDITPERYWKYLVRMRVFFSKSIIEVWYGRWQIDQILHDIPREFPF